MEIQTPKSTCRLCGGEFARRGMTRHIQSCLAKHLSAASKGKPRELVHLHVQDAFNPDYFLYLLMAAGSPLEVLDAYLREIWLECCGHLSAFSVERYGEEIRMGDRIGDVFAAVGSLYHQYDFGSTTELAIRELGRYRGVVKNKIQLLARNAPPVIPCSECNDRPAVAICTECVWNGAGWLCASCETGHECDEEMLLPVVNSPRTGVCAYTGGRLAEEDP